MVDHTVVSHDKWVEARKKHLAKEKEFTHLRDQLSRERRELPWELVDKDYTFDLDSNVVEVHVGNLRRKIDQPFGRRSLETVRGFGYRLRDDDAPP